MAELVDALVSGTSAARRGGSSPLLGTSSTGKPTLCRLFCCRSPTDPATRLQRDDTAPATPGVAFPNRQWRDTLRCSRPTMTESLLAIRKQVAIMRALAQMAELVDALVSGTSAARRGGSSPLLGTISRQKPVERPAFAFCAARSNRPHSPAPNPAPRTATLPDDAPAGTGGCTGPVGADPGSFSVSVPVKPAQAPNGWRRRMVSSRSGPVEITSIGTSMISSMRCR